MRTVAVDDGATPSTSTGVGIAPLSAASELATNTVSPIVGECNTALGSHASSLSSSSFPEPLTGKRSRKRLHFSSTSSSESEEVEDDPQPRLGVKRGRGKRRRTLRRGGERGDRAISSHTQPPPPPPPRAAVLHQAAAPPPQHQGVLDAIVWTEGHDFTPAAFDFDNREAGVQPELGCIATSKIMDYFLACFDEAIMNIIVDETNHHRQLLWNLEDPATTKIHSKNPDWSDVTIRELYVWLALTMLMGHVKKHVLKEYWSKDELITTPIFGKYMSRFRYLQIFKFLHFTTNMGPYPCDRLWKIRTVLSMFQERIRIFFRPYQKLVIDESLVLFRGRLGFIQYIPSKRNRFGLKFFVLCDCKTGYVMDFVIYTGTEVDIKSKDDPHGFSGAVVKTLMDTHFKKNHILYTDNYYTSPSLTKFLLEEETGTCGTVRSNRKHWPAFPADKRRGDIFKKKSGNMLAIQWIDKRPVNMLTTAHRGAMEDSGKVDRHTREPVMKPDVVNDYNINMRLVDKSDMMISTVDCLRKKRKWYLKIFLHLLDLAVLNCHILHHEVSQKNISLRQFEKELVRQLLEKFGTVQPQQLARPAAAKQPDRLFAADYLSRHHLEYLEPTRPQRKTGTRRCHVCRTTTCRPQRLKETNVKCKECQVALCPTDCFRDYHMLENY